MGEDGSEVDKEGCVGIAVVVVGEETELFLIGEVAALLCSRPHHLLQHLAHLLVGEGEAAYKQFRREEQQGF